MENKEKKKEVGIEKAKINKDGFLECAFYQVEKGVYSQHTVTIHRPVHQDLHNCFQRLNTHLCLITEQVGVGTCMAMLEEPLNRILTISQNGTLEGNLLIGSSPLDEAFETGKIFELECFSRFKCTGLINKPEGVMLVGQRILKTSKVVNLISPLLGSDEEYEFFFRLGQDFQDTMDEVERHLNGKCGEGDQLNLFEEAD